MESGQPTAPEGDNQGLKKGPWTVAEDAILIEYVKKHGEGNWNSVQKNCGLMRCGKSCRLRWANHLRPNLKKGSFTPEEEKIIIELHAKHGNKWARMASQLPGRTDNEIKNYWNTRMKRHQKAGLPIYPQDFQAKTAAFRFHHQEDRRTQPNSTSLSSSPYILCFPPLDPNNSFATPLNPSQSHLSPLAFHSNPSHQLKLFANTNSNDVCLPLSLPPVSPYQQSPLSTNPLSQNPTRQAVAINTPPSVLFYNDVDMETNMSFTSLIMGGQVQPIGFIPSGQTPPGPTTSWGGGACFEEASNKSNNNGYGNSETSQQGMAGNMNNSGLLDALLQEAKTIRFKGKSNSDDLLPACNEGKRAMDSTVKEEATNRVELLPRNGSEYSCGEKLWDDLSSSQSSNIWTKPSEEAAGQELNSMDDDLISLLNHFPSSEPLPEWYRQSRNERNSNRMPYSGLNIVDDNRDPDVKEDASLTRASNTEGVPNRGRALVSCHWNNMPGIC
ncbi:PREDICTED: uncharacterized protein LOC105112461 [Populus euphratica]|uniref:Uncharacterized protein LOC105112461 n=1 Tax=Populus euphratica TaxID=75702 RepID=A0AAJ6X5T3_POPEU|nr:PREDICTED: uncharacterized protein LOC105112461 [Populus euphratica]